VSLSVLCFNFTFLDQKLQIPHRYSSYCSCWGDRLQLRRFKSNRDEIWQKCSSSKHTSIDGVGFSIWRHTFQRDFKFEMAAMTSFHTEKRYHLVRAYAKLQRPPHMQTSWLAILSTVSGLQYDVHTYLFLFGILGVDLSLCSGLLAIVRCINWCCIDFYCVSLC